MPLPADSKQNGEANVVLSDEEQPLSPAEEEEEEKRPMRGSSTRDKNKKSSTCFLLATGDFSCAADGGIQKGRAGGVTGPGQGGRGAALLGRPKAKAHLHPPAWLFSAPQIPVLLPLHLLHHISPCCLQILFSPPQSPPFGVCDPALSGDRELQFFSLGFSHSSRDAGSGTSLLGGCD